MEKVVSFKSDGLTLCGIAGTPDDVESPGRGVVLVHGWGGYRIGPRRILVHAARRLNDAGFATLRFDLRGRGDSEGDGRNTSLDDMISDTLNAIDFMQKEQGVERISLLGICSGSNVAIGAASLRREGIERLVLWSALPFQPDKKTRQRVRRARFQIGQYARKALRPSTWKRMFRGEVDVRMVGKAIGGESRPAEGEVNLKDSARDIMAAFAGFRGKALFIAGTSDPEGMEGRELFESFCRAKNIDAEFRLIEGATHSYYASAHEEEVIAATLAWLEGRA